MFIGIQMPFQNGQFMVSHNFHNFIFHDATRNNFIFHDATRNNFIFHDATRIFYILYRPTKLDYFVNKYFL
jgi:hypothetical protein